MKTNKKAPAKKVKRTKKSLSKKMKTNKKAPAKKVKRTKKKLGNVEDIKKACQFGGFCYIQKDGKCSKCKK